MMNLFYGRLRIIFIYKYLSVAFLCPKAIPKAVYYRLIKTLQPPPQKKQNVKIKTINLSGEGIP